MKPGPARSTDAPAGETAPAPAFAILRLVALAVCVAAWIGFRLGTSICLEDALITFRYAENLARGAGFVFNPGERVLGTTSPLMTLLLAAPAALLGPAAIPAVAVVLGMASALAGLVLLESALAACGVGRALRIAGVLAAGLHPEMLWSITGGLETPLLLCAMATGLDAMARERWRLTAVASALAVLIRPDAAVWAGIVVLVAAVRLRGAVWKPVLVGAAVLAPWVAFAWAYFGSPVPHSVIAKRVIQSPVEVDYLRWLVESLWIPKSFGRLPLEMGLWCCLAAVGAGVVIASRRFRPLIALALFPPAFGAALWLGRAPEFPWYLLPVTWCSIALGTIGSAVLAGRDESTRASRPAPRAWMVAAVWALELIAIARWDAEGFRYQRATQQNEDSMRRRAGEWLGANTAPGAAVAMEAIGYQGTFARRRIIDLSGLVTPQVVRIHRATRTNAEAFERVLEELDPDALVLRSIEVDQNIHFQGGPLFETEAQLQRFGARYAEAIRMTAPHPELWGPSGSITIYVRSPRAP